MRLAGMLVVAALMLALTVVWIGCAEKITNDQSDQYNVILRASLGSSAAASPDEDTYRYRLRVTARDMDPIDTLLTIENGWIVGRIEVPAGLARHFVLTAEEWVITVPVTHAAPEDTAITVIFRGETTADVLPGQAVHLNVSMRPLIPMVKLSPKYSHLLGGTNIDLDVMIYNVPDLYYVDISFILPWDALEPYEIVKGSTLGDNVEFNSGFVEGVYIQASDTANPNNPMPIVDSRGDLELATIRARSRVAAGDPLTDMAFVYSIYALDTAGTPALGDSIAIDTAYLTLAPVADMVVTFPDANLDDAIRYNLYIDDTTTLMLSYLLTNLEYLEASESGISDLTNLNLVANLEYLYIGYNEITDITPLASLTGLKELELQYSQIVSVDPLAPLTLLYDLQLSYCGISDITELRHLTRLENLDLSYNQITDIAPLVNNSGLGQNAQVNLCGNPLSATSVEVYLPQLRERGVEVLYEVCAW